VMDGEQPARVPDAVISEIRSRERNGFVELPKPRGFVCLAGSNGSSLRETRSRQLSRELVKARVTSSHALLIGESQAIDRECNVRPRNSSMISKILSPEYPTDRGRFPVSVAPPLCGRKDRPGTAR
jgi:hypothetical protein